MRNSSKADDGGASRPKRWRFGRRRPSPPRSARLATPHTRPGVMFSPPHDNRAGASEQDKSSTIARGGGVSGTLLERSSFSDPPTSATVCRRRATAHADRRFCPPPTTTTPHSKPARGFPATNQWRRPPPPAPSIHQGIGQASASTQRLPMAPLTGGSLAKRGPAAGIAKGASARSSAPAGSACAVVGPARCLPTARCRLSAGCARHGVSGQVWLARSRRHLPVHPPRRTQASTKWLRHDRRTCTRSHTGPPPAACPVGGALPKAV